MCHLCAQLDYPRFKSEVHIRGPPVITKIKDAVFSRRFDRSNLIYGWPRYDNRQQELKMPLHLSNANGPRREVPLAMVSVRRVRCSTNHCKHRHVENFIT